MRSLKEKKKEKEYDFWLFIERRSCIDAYLQLGTWFGTELTPFNLRFRMYITV